MHVKGGIERMYFICDRCQKRFLYREHCIKHEEAKLCKCLHCETRRAECREECMHKNEKEE